MCEATRELVRQFADHLESGRPEQAFRMLNADGRYILTGTTPASGVYEGVDDLFTRLAPHLSRFTGAPDIKVSDVLVDGDKAFLRASGRAAAAYGTYDQPYYGFFLHAKGDGFAEIVEFLDTVQIEVALFGRKLVSA